MQYRKIKNLLEQVRWCLEHQPETRNSDIALTVAVWREFYPEYVTEAGVPFGSLYTLPREDSVKRLRAKIQNDPIKPTYLPTRWDVAKKRGISELEWRVAMGYPATSAPDYTPPSEMPENKVYTFSSASKPKLKHQVKVLDIGIVCTCDGFRYRGVCKHQHTVARELETAYTPKLV